jgi:hypothetical protein
MQVSFADFDRLQNNLRQAQDDILRLTARVTALEGGEALPPDQTITLPTEPVVCEPAPAPVIVVRQPDIDTELDLTRGLTAGGRRG